MDMSELAEDYLVDPKEGMKNLTATALWLEPTGCRCLAQQRRSSQSAQPRC